MDKNNYTFFIVKNRALGDSIMGLSTISYLRSMYPKSNIIYAVPQWMAKLYSKVKTDADLIYPLKLNSLADLLELYSDLIDLKVDAIHEMHQSGKGKKIFSAFSFLKGIPYTAHNHHLNSKTKVIDQGIKKELIQRDLDGIFSFYGKGDIPNFLDFEPSINIESVKKVKRIILGVVATRKTKMWPLENYITISKKILEVDGDFEIVIPLSRSSEDLEIKNSLQKLIDDNRIKVIQLALEELPEYFSNSSIYIGNDTGLKHLAVAVKIPSITMFGPEPIREWHPYNVKNHPAFFVQGLNCRTRTHHYCGLSLCDLPLEENLQCLKMITPEEVFLKFKELISAKS